MGRTLATASQTWMEEEKALTRFARALRKDDQLIMNELIRLSRLHIAESSYAGNMYPMDIYIISMILELSKKLDKLEKQLNEISKAEGIQETSDTDTPDFPSLTDLLQNDP